MSADGAVSWVDPDAIRQLVDSVRDGFAAAPVWARTALVAMLGVAVLAGVFRVSRALDPSECGASSCWNRWGRKRSSSAC